MGSVLALEDVGPSEQVGVRRTYTYNHPELDRIWAMSGVYYGPFKDNILSNPGWLYV